MLSHPPKNSCHSGTTQAQVNSAGITISILFVSLRTILQLDARLGPGARPSATAQVRSSWPANSECTFEFPAFKHFKSMLTTEPKRTFFNRV